MSTSTQSGAGRNRSKQPHPPVLVGGAGPRILDRVLAFGDAWFPDYGPTDLLERMQELRSRADRPVSVGVIGVPAGPRVLEQLEIAGVRRVVHWLPSAGPRRVQTALDRFGDALNELYGE